MTEPRDMLTDQTGAAVLITDEAGLRALADDAPDPDAAHALVDGLLVEDPADGQEQP